MYSYKKLEKKLEDNNLNKSDLVKILNISSRTIAKIKKNEKISNYTLEKMADYFCCEREALYKEEADNRILQQLRDEKSVKLSNGLYHELQIRMTYNSNHMEGSKLSEEQTRLIFETNTIDCSGGVLVDDILETVNHFRAIDYCIDVALEPLSEEIIKQIHYILKQNTKDSTLDWFKVGDYKLKGNVINGKETAKPKDVPLKMKKLLEKYHKNDEVTFEDIVDFHYEFEQIHPFQDGNGRVGRLIAFKECLYHDIVPFIIGDSKKMYYYRGLINYKEEKDYLFETCLDGQDTFRRLLKLFEE